MSPKDVEHQHMSYLLIFSPNLSPEKSSYVSG
jgi:hypothetical protein